MYVHHKLQCERIVSSGRMGPMKVYRVRKARLLTDALDLHIYPRAQNLVPAINAPY